MIREYNKCDLSQVLALYARFVREFGEVPDRPPDLLKGKCFVADVDGRIVGFGFLRETTIYGRRFTQGVHLYVDKTYRRSSTSRALYRACRRHVRAVGVKLVIIADEGKQGQWLKAGYKPWKVLMVRDA